MRKICKYCLTLVAILACTNAWGQICIPIGGVEICNIPFYAKVSAQVSSKTPNGGNVYVYSPARVDTIALNYGPSDPYDEVVARYSAKTAYINEPVYALYEVFEMGSAHPVAAHLYAFPEAGYYFKGWSQVDNDYDLGAGSPFTPSVLSMAIPEPKTTETGVGVKWPTDDQIPSIGTFYATFKPVLVNECVEGDNLFMTTEDEEQTFDVYFSTSFASQGIEDFENPILTNAETEGGVFATNGNCKFTEDNEVKVPLKFTPNTNLQEGVYSCQLTVASKGGSSITTTIKMTVEEEPEYEATIGDTHYNTFEDALAAANDMSNAVITLAKNVDVTTAQMVYANMTIDLNGKVLKGTAEQVLIIAGGNLTLVDSKKIGKIQHNLSAPGQTVVISAGSVVMNGGEVDVDGENVSAIKVEQGASFEMNDGVIVSDYYGIYNQGDVTIHAGNVVASTEYYTPYAIYTAGTLNINGGEIIAEQTAGPGETHVGYGIYVAEGVANIAKAKIRAFGEDNIYGIYSAGNTTISGKAAIMVEAGSGSNYAAVNAPSGTINLNGVKLFAAAGKEFTSNSHPSIQAAYFVTNNWLQTYQLAEGQKIYDVSAGKEYLEGYRYFLGDAGTAKDNGTAVCKIGNMGYATLEDALFYAQNNLDEKVIITMVNDYTLPAGWYTLPSNASLLVPYCAEQTALMGKNVHKLPAGAKPTPPTPYKTLTIASSAHIDVFGSIEVSCIQRIQGMLKDGCAVPDGPFGWIKMEQGSEITLNNGSHLYAWGFVTGKGEIEARRGCTVHEDFQVYDWDGGQNAFNAVISAIQSGAGVFPITQYAMQNIECPVTYHPGSHMYASFGATANALGMDIQVAADEIGIVGVTDENAMFLMDDNADADNTWVRKYYDTETDQQVYEVNSSAHLGSMVIEIPVFKMVGALFGVPDLTGFDSKNFVLPITSNMKLHLLSGMMDITQNTEFLPGSELEVNKTSTMIVRDEKDIVYDGRVIFVDDDDWKDNFGFNETGTPYKQIAYSPTFNGTPDKRNISRAPDSNKRPVGDAKLNVHGTFQVDGSLLTTQGRATIFSNNEDAGTIIFTQKVNFMDNPNKVAAPTESMMENAYGISSLDGIVNVPHLNMHSNSTELLPLKSAFLRNTEGQTPEFTNTGNDENPTLPGESYCFLRDRWTKMDQFDENFAYDNFGAWYIKPGEYVAIATTTKDPVGTYKDADASTQPLENEDHTYSDANGEGRLFILVYNGDKGGWQCWEVTIQDNLYRGTNGTYYYYYEDKDNSGWMEKTFSVTWKNWNGEQCGEVYKLYYGTTPKYNGVNPSREEDGDYTYTFTGWTPEIVPVHEDAIYTATYERSPRKYTIIFEAENGEEIERHFYTKGEMPECEDVPHKVGYYLQWEPSLGAVKGDATYRATFLPEKPKEFEVTFVNYDGYELQKGDVAVGTTPEYSDIPTREPSDEYTYEFACWSPELKPVDAAITYTAVFNEKPREYEIEFFKKGEETPTETKKYAYGAVPTAPEYSKEATAEYTYTTVWTPTITAVTGPATYTGEFIETKNKYTVTVNAIGCVVEGAGAYDYGTEVTLHITDASVPGFNQDAKWKQTGDSEDITIFKLEGDVTYTAEATPINNIVAEIGGEPVNITAPIEAASFTIKANTNASGQVIGAENIELVPAGKAYFEYTFNAQAMKWYAFAVPFVCDANTLRNATRTLIPGVDYDIMQYNGATRATAGADRSAWEYISDKGINVLTPGRLYMILFAQAQTTAITFTKTPSASIVYTAPVTMNQYPADDDLNANWNGVANPKLFYANLGTGVEYGQIYNGGGDDSYTKITLSGYDFPVGKPVFVQAQTQSQVEVTPSASAAPLRRLLKAEKQECEISLTQGNKECDNLSIIMNDDAEDRYVIGEDLAKAGVSTKVAQMWINRYNAKLCVNSIAAEDEVATYPLGIFAPKAGAYTIAAASVPANTAVYLTEDDNIIADLTTMPYMLDLSKGTHNEFSLRMVGKTQPSVVTDFQEASINGKGVQKVIKNNTLYILRADKVFNAQGQLVK